MHGQGCWAVRAVLLGVWRIRVFTSFEVLAWLAWRIAKSPNRRPGLRARVQITPTYSKMCMGARGPGLLDLPVKRIHKNENTVQHYK
jgi:hypothetical protein